MSIRIACVDCGALKPKDGKPRCDECNRAHNKQHNAKRQNLYNSNHRRIRAGFAPAVAAGLMRCARCNNPITPKDTWHLDHVYHGNTDEFDYFISHSDCNSRSTRPRLNK